VNDNELKKNTDSGSEYIEESKQNSHKTGILRNLIAKFLKLKLLYMVLIIAGILLFIILPAMIQIGMFSNVFASKQIRIADTAIIVKEVKDIAQLFSLAFFDEVVVDSTEKRSKQLVYVVKGKVYAGFDLSTLDDDAISIQDTILNIRIGKPQILDVVVNPSDFTVFHERGRWSFEETQAVQIKAQEKIRQRAIERGIIENSAKNGIRSLESFYKALGFKEVNITLRD